MIVLKIFAVYMLIGLALEVAITGKKTVEGLTSGKYGYIDTFFRTIVLAFIAIPAFIYGIFIGIKEVIDSTKEDI
jgi:hypothetical protein|nr:MAG TPA: hypothetical protein [Caudoviricetes sp.]